MWQDFSWAAMLYRHGTLFSFSCKCFNCRKSPGAKGRLQLCWCPTALTLKPLALVGTRLCRGSEWCCEHWALPTNPSNGGS